MVVGLAPVASEGWNQGPETQISSVCGHFEDDFSLGGNISFVSPLEALRKLGLGGVVNLLKPQ